MNDKQYLLDDAKHDAKVVFQKRDNPRLLKQLKEIDMKTYLKNKNEEEVIPILGEAFEYEQGPVIDAALKRLKSIYKEKELMNNVKECIDREIEIHYLLRE